MCFGEHINSILVLEQEITFLCLGKLLKSFPEWLLQVIILSAVYESSSSAHLHKYLVDKPEAEAPGICICLYICMNR